MDCAHCKRRIAECVCPKELLNGKWPRGTWFQKRLTKVRVIKMIEDKHKVFTPDAGYAFLQVLCFLAVAGLIVTALLTFGVFARGVVENLQSVDRCIKALLECVNI